MNYKDGNFHLIILQEADAELDIGHITALVRWDVYFKNKDESIGAWELAYIKHQYRNPDYQHRGMHLSKSSFKNTNGEPKFVNDGRKENQWPIASFLN